jgi:two-component system, chemotaxis family, chemotaxis protein CheY
MSMHVPANRVLVADPSSHMAGLVTLMLHSLKIRAVDEVGSIQRATEALGRRVYTLVLIDEQLSGTDDFAMIRTLRKSTEHPNRAVPIIMMAMSPDARMIAAARDAGVTEFLRKPFSAQHISLRIDAIRNAPRDFVDTDAYVGPDRRRRAVGGVGRRRSSDSKQSA